MSNKNRFPTVEETPAEANGSEPDPLAIAKAELDRLIDELDATEAERKRSQAEFGKSIRALDKSIMDATRRVRNLEKEASKQTLFAKETANASD